MTLFKSGNKYVQFLGVIVGIYMAYTGYKYKNNLLILIGILMALYDGYLVIFE